MTTSTPHTSGANTNDPATTDVAAGEAKQVAASAKEKASGVASEAADHARSLVGEARSAGRDQAEAQGQQLSSLAKDVAGELRSMASSDSGSNRLGGLANQGAELLQRTAERFDDDGLDAITSDVTRFARKRPFVFIAATFAAGIGVGRVLRHADTDELRDVASSATGADDQSAPSSTAPSSTGPPSSEPPPSPPDSNFRSAPPAGTTPPRRATTTPSTPPVDGPRR